MIRVALVAEQGLVRAGLRILLDTEPDIEVLLDVPTVERAGGDVPSIDVVVLVTASELDPDAFREVRARLGNDHLLVLSPDAAPEQIGLAIASGARGYLLEESGRREFLEAVRKVSRGEAHVQERIGTIAGRRPASGAARPEPRRGLSPREREVLALLARGHTNAEIATTLGVSPRTVAAHRRHILQKLAVRSRAEIVRYAQAEGLL